MLRTSRLLHRTIRYIKNLLGVPESSIPRLHTRPTREDVVQAFRLILGREPEDEHVIESHSRALSVAELRLTLLASAEFAGKYRTLHPVASEHPDFNRGRPAVVFIHLQKTGGTSLRELLGSQFAPERRCPVLEDKLHLLTLAEIGAYDFFAGHYDISSLKIIPRDHISTLAMFREPHARLVSLYRFLKSHPTSGEFANDNLIPLAHSLTAEQFFERAELRGYSAINNHYLIAFGRSFSLFDRFNSPLDATALANAQLEAKRQIRGLTSIGITEQFTDSVKLICSTLGLTPPATVNHLHATDGLAAKNTRFRQVESVEVTPRLAAAMRDLVEHDAVLYLFAVTEFDRRMGRLGSGPESQLGIGSHNPALINDQ